MQNTDELKKNDHIYADPSIHATHIHASMRKNLQKGTMQRENIYG